MPSLPVSVSLPNPARLMFTLEFQTESGNTWNRAAQRPNEQEIRAVAPKHMNGRRDSWSNAGTNWRWRIIDPSGKATALADTYRPSPWG